MCVHELCNEYVPHTQVTRYLQVQVKRVLSIILLTAAAFFGVTGFAYAEEVCEASWYGPGLQGNLMANEKPFNMDDPTVVAHKTYPLGTVLRITNLENGKSIRVVVQDRGPYIQGRCVDLSKAAAAKLGYLNAGTARVSVVRL